MATQRPRHSQPRRRARRLTVAFAVGLVLLSGATAVAVHAATRPDCSLTPQIHPPDAIGVSLERLHGYLADKYATDVQDVVIVAEGPQSITLAVVDPGNDQPLGVFRADRAPSGGGWLLTTTDTCGD